jgi:hypothetical protein
MGRWTLQQVEALAPDDRAVAAARKLARPGPWSSTGSTEALVWGSCQGSGSTPYHVSVDLTGPAFRCSCPSRKLPCKHGLALLLLWVRGDGSVADVESPAAFAREWADDRTARAERSAARSDAPAKAPDPAAQAKRLEDRLALMDAGMADLETWLGDLVRQGLAGARQRPYAYWDDAAARLVDAQLPALAERVRAMASLVQTRSDWADHLLAEAGRWWCAAQAWRRRGELSPADVANLRAFVGWPYAGDEIRAGDTVSDRWLVLGVHRTDDGRLQAQRTWLAGSATGALVVVLDFAAVGGTLGVAKVVGTIVEATVALYPGTEPRRALFVGEPAVVGAAGALPGAGPIEHGLERVARWLGDNPWPDRFPVAVGGATVVLDDEASGAGRVVDTHGRALGLAAGVDAWPLLARTGGHPTDLFGELEDGCVRPLTLALDGELVSV